MEIKPEFITPKPYQLIDNPKENKPFSWYILPTWKGFKFKITWKFKGV